jgi:hypothetical protein
MFNLFLILITSLLTSYQVHGQDGKTRELLIDNSSFEKLKDISDVIDDITIVPLNESSENYIGDIYKFFVSEGRYIVFDKIRTNTIVAFDKNGNYIKTVMKTGKGPGETLQINDCWPLENGEIEVYDFALKIIYQFDSKLVLKNKVKCPEPYILDDIKKVPNSDFHIGYTDFFPNNPKNGKCYHIAFLDQKLGIIRTDLFYDQKYQGIQWVSIKNHFYQYKDSIRLFMAFDNNVYNVSISGIDKLYRVVYKKNPMPDDIFEKVVGKNQNPYRTQIRSAEELRKRYATFDIYSYFNGQWLENDRYIYVASKEKNIWFYSIIDKKTMKSKYIANDFCETKRFKINIPYLQYFDAESNTFIGFVTGLNMKKYLLNDSKFLKELTIDPSVNYIFRIKLKNL